MQTGELTSDITEDRTEGEQVKVDLDTAAMEAAKPSLVGGVEETVEIQETQSDHGSFDEEFTEIEEVKVDLVSSKTDDKPATLVQPVLEGATPSHITEELRDSIKEVRLFPGFVAPEYEPSAVEKYRFEATIMPEYQTQQQQIAVTTEKADEAQIQVIVSAHEKTETVQRMAASMAQSIVRAVTEVTEEQEHVTEVITEEVEVIKKPVEEVIESEEIAPAAKAPTAKQLMAPVFEIPLSDVTVVDGERAYLEARVTGVPMPIITWYVDATEVKPSQDVRVFYEDGLCVLDIADTLPEDEGEYTIKAVNEAGTCVTTAYLTVLPPSGSEPETPVEEAPMTFERTITVQSTGEKVIEEKKKLEIDVSVQSKKVQKAVVEVAIPAEPTAPVFGKKLEPKEVFETMPVKLECEVTGNPVPEITWYRDGKKVTSTKHIQLEYTQGKASINIDHVTIEDEAEYKVEARNELGMTSCWAELLVESKHYKQAWAHVMQHAKINMAAASA
jgi:hypothetical protein